MGSDTDTLPPSSSSRCARPSHGSHVGSSVSGRLLPARLDDSGDLPGERQLAEADSAQSEVAQERARTAAAAAAVVRADRELRLPLPLLDQRLLGHTILQVPNGPPPGAPLRPGRHAGFL